MHGTLPPQQQCGHEDDEPQQQADTDTFPVSTVLESNPMDSLSATDAVATITTAVVDEHTSGEPTAPGTPVIRVKTATEPACDASLQGPLVQSDQEHAPDSTSAQSDSTSLAQEVNAMLTMPF